LNFAPKTFRVKQEGQDTTCCAVLLVEHKNLRLPLSICMTIILGMRLFVNGLTSLWLSKKQLWGGAV
jgi:hypothetical protein